MLSERLAQVYLTSLEGLGSSYRMKGYFTLKSSSGDANFGFEGVAFGGNYGGHNVSINLEEDERSRISVEAGGNEAEIEDLLSEIQRRLLNNEMVVEYEGIKQEKHDEIGLP